MKLRFDESKICYYADKYLDEEEGYDDPVEEIVDEVKQRGYLTKSDLIVVSKWVRCRRIDLIKSHNDDFIKERTCFALSSTTAELDRVRLAGVGWSVASAILHWFHQDDYPIWSEPARYSVHLDEKQCKAQYKNDSERWHAYVIFCRCLAKKNKVNMRTLDRALWKYCDDQRA